MISHLLAVDYWNFFWLINQISNQASSHCLSSTYTEDA